jgi:hypothetical protein
MMSLDDALVMAGQVLADYEASGLEVAPGAERIWPGRLAQALRDLAGAAAAWYASPSGQPSATVLDAVIGQLQDAITRMDSQAARLEVAGTSLAAPAEQPARPRLSGRWRRLTRGRARPQPERREPGSVVLSSGEADTAWQAAADAAAWHAEYGDCATCVDSGACSDPARHDAITAAYAQLRSRIGGAWR